jgi:hypothetical protein
MTLNYEALLVYLLCVFLLAAAFTSVMAIIKRGEGISATYNGHCNVTDCWLERVRVQKWMRINQTNYTK